MALEIRDRVKETCTGTSGDMTLTGAVSGFVGFDLDATLDGDTIYYALEDADGTKWEVGLGTLSADSTSIERTTILATQVSFTDTTRQTFSGGTHTIFATYPASKAVYLDASGNLSHTVDISSDTNLAGGTGITLTGDTLSTTDSEIVHDNLSGFVANEHIDWTTDQGSTNIHAGNYTDTNTMGSGFTVSATTDTTATTITEGEDLFFAAGTGITCETTADGTVTISCTVTDTNTQLSQEQVEDYVDGLLTAGSNISLTYDDAAGTLTIASAHPNISAASSSDNSGRTYIQDITVDSNGHVTGIATATETVTDTNTMGSGFTVSATTDSNATTITQGDDLMFAAGTGITCETTADGTVTISCTVTDTNTTYTGGTNLTLAGTTFNVDDAFLKNDADDTTSGKITAAGYAISAVVTESGTSRTLADSDNGKVIVCTNGSATTITVPASLATGFAVTVIQTGAGQITFSASSTTINNRQSHTKTAGQHARVGLVQTSSDTYNLGGDTAS